MAKIKKKQTEIFQIPLLESVNQDYVERAFKLSNFSLLVSQSFSICYYSLFLTMSETICRFLLSSIFRLLSFSLLD